MSDGIEQLLGTETFWTALEKAPEQLAAKLCEIDLVNLDETLQKHPALRAWLSAAHETARITEERKKWELTKAEASALLEFKKTIDPDTGKAKTVQVLAAEVEKHPAVMQATEEYLKAQEVRSILRSITDSLEHRLQMLIQLSAKQRAELADYSRHS